MADTTEARWRQRFRAPRTTFPAWARDEPDRLLYASNVEGKWELYAWDRREESHRRVTDRTEGTQIGALDPAGERIWWFDDERGNELGRWMVEPFALGAPGQAGGGKRPGTPGPDLPPAYDAGLALARGFAVIGTSTDDGCALYLARDGDRPRLLYAHREDARVAGLSRDQRLLCISHAEHGDSRHPALRVVDLDGKPAAELWDGPGRGLWAAGWSRVYGDGRLLVLHEREDLHRPLIWTPEDDDVRELRIELPGEVRVSWYPDGRALLVVHDYRGRSELYRYDIDSDDLSQLTTDAGTITGAGVRPDGEVWYGWSSSPSPPAVVAQRGMDQSVVLRPPGTGDTEPSHAQRVGYGPPLVTHSWEDTPLAGVPYRDYQVDGIHGFLAIPRGDIRPYPTVVWVHGGPTAHDRDEYAPRVQAFVDHGFAVVLVNYRGSSGYGRAWRDALEGNPGFTELEDIAKVRDWLVAQGIADPARLVLAGGSWGGYLTLLGLGTQPERWSLGLAAVPVADYVAAFEDEMEPLKAFDRALFGGTPQERPGFYRERSPITYVERVRVPVLILAGENDPRCPIRQIDKYIARLRELEKPHEVYRYHAGHGSLVVDEMIRHVEVMLDFAARRLGTPTPK